MARMAEPYHALIRRLLKERGIARPGYTGTSALWRLITRAGYDLSHEQVRLLLSGTPRGSKRGKDNQPRPETLEAVAAALDISPYEFAEYRLAKVREMFDEREGLDEALDNLARLAPALAELDPEISPEGILGDPPPGPIRRLAEQPPSAPDPRRQGSPQAAPRRRRG